MESKTEKYWKSLSREAKEKGLQKSIDDVERVWRQIRNELSKEGIKPDDPKFNALLMTRTKKKVLEESKSLIQRTLDILQDNMEPLWEESNFRSQHTGLPVIVYVSVGENEGMKFLEELQKDLQKRYEETQKKLEDRVQQAVKDFMKKADVVTGDELKALKKEIRELKKAISEGSDTGK